MEERCKDCIFEEDRVLRPYTNPCKNCLEKHYGVPIDVILENSKVEIKEKKEISTMFKLNENYNREEEIKGIKYNNKNGTLSGRSKEELEEKRQEEVNKLLKLAETIKNMTIEEYDVYFDTTSLCFENALCDAQDSGILDSVASEIGRRYGIDETIYYVTSISHYEPVDEENEDWD